MRYLLTVIMLIAGISASGQQIMDRITVDLENIPLSEAVAGIEKASGYTFFYDEEQVDLTLHVTLKADAQPLGAALETMLAPVGLAFEIRQKQIILFPASINIPGGKLITGTVLDVNEEPLVGVAVMVEGTAAGTATDSRGCFSLSVPAGIAPVLTFSSLGYVTKKVSVPDSRQDIKVYMNEDATMLDATVVVGYGTQKKVNLTGAVSTIQSESIQNRTATSLTHMLQGAIPGLNVTTSSGYPGSSASINIRGINSINGGSPLVLIDGAEGDLKLVNPNDVESISVVKDASSSAIYGARASFGVVMVTTKQGNKNDGKVKVNYSGRFGWGAPTTSTDFETRGYYSVYLNDLFYKSYAGVNYSRYTEADMNQLWLRRNDKVENPQRPWVVIDQRSGQDTYVYYANTDWYHELFRDTHPNMSHNISFSGAAGKVKYYLSGGYYSEEGIFRKHPDKFRKINFRSRISFDVNDWINISNNTSYYNSSYDYPGPGGVNTSFSLSTVHALASYPARNPDGSSIYLTSFSSYGIMDGLPTILDKDLHRNTDHQDNISTTTELTLTPVKGLEIKGNFTYMFNSVRFTNRQVNTTYSTYPGVIETLNTGRFENKLTETFNTHRYMQTNVYATYQNSFAAKHNLKVMAGFNWETKYLKDVKATGYNLLSDTLNDLNLVGQDADGEKRMEVSGGQNEYAIAGVFGRVNYDYEGKYPFQASHICLAGVNLLRRLFLLLLLLTSHGRSPSTRISV